MAEIKNSLIGNVIESLNRGEKGKQRMQRRNNYSFASTLITLMQLGLPNQIVVVDSNLESELNH